VWKPKAVSTIWDCLSPASLTNWLFICQYELFLGICVDWVFSVIMCQSWQLLQQWLPPAHNNRAVYPAHNYTCVTISLHSSKLPLFVMQDADSWSHHLELKWGTGCRLSCSADSQHKYIAILLLLHILCFLFIGLLLTSTLCTTAHVNKHKLYEVWAGLQ